MPFDGNGNFTPQTPQYPAITGTVIQAADWNAIVLDLANGLSNAITRDGQSPPTSNIPMAGQRLLNIGAPTSLDDVIRVQEVQDGTYNTVTSIGGTADAITGSVPLLAVLAAGHAFRFIAAAANTGAVTLNINGLGVKDVTKEGTTALAAGDIVSGAVVSVIYDGTRFQIVNSKPQGRYIGTQIFTATGIYTPTPGTAFIVVEVQAPGGGSGGCAATSASQVSGGGAGGGGGYAKKRITSAFSGVTVTVGAAGTAGTSSTAGGAGGATSFGAIITCNGGSGGSNGTATASLTALFAVPGGAGGSASGGDININGSRGATGFSISGTSVVGGQGGAAFMGGPSFATYFLGGAPVASAGIGYGSGAGAPANSVSGAASAGAAGAPGIVIVHEYS